MIAAWKDVQAETTRLKEQLRERNVRQKALEEVIMRIMKTHNIGALDLKASNARLLHKQKQAKGSLNKKSMTEYLSEFLKSEEEGKKAVAFMDEKRGVVKRDVLAFENL
jgi:ABC-type phosphate transport system auxiliary subunit